MELMINNAGMKGVISDIANVEKSIENSRSQVSDIASALSIQGDGSVIIKDTMKAIVSDMDMLIKKLAKMENGLELILDAYFQCEKSIMGISIGSGIDIKDIPGSSNDSETFKELKNWFESLLDMIKKWKEKSEEEQADKDMQKEIRKLLSSDKRFSSKAWLKATEEEREQILRELLTELEKIYNIDISDINFEKIETESEGTTLGVLNYSESGDMTITLNDKLVKNDLNYMSAINTLLHEMRHGYQHSVCDNPEKYENVSEETIESWRDNFSDYKTSEDDGFDAYEKQPVEQDARDFSEGVTGKTPFYDNDKKRDAYK